MDYRTSLDYIDSFINFEKIPRYSYASSFKLERMRTFLRELGDPQKDFKVIHVAGSKGKGSICAITAFLLKHAGYRVGLYTSPHLLDIRERIRVLEKKPGRKSKDIPLFEGAIKEEELIELVERIKPVTESFRDRPDLGKLSFFEVLTACSFLYFKDKKADFVVLETGLGGRLDATNVIDPLMCGIANISMEHADKLGDTLESIALEKAGIIKSCCGVISAPQREEIGALLRAITRDMHVKLYEIGKDIKFNLFDSTIDSQIFGVEGPDFSYDSLELNLLGVHQIENASLAVGITELIDEPALKIGEDAIRAGLKEVSWPGRMQIMQKDPYVILDGAQNVASIEALLFSIKMLFGFRRIITVFGISNDKDIKGVSKELSMYSDIALLTRSRSERAEDPSRLREFFPKVLTETTDSVQEALRVGIKMARPEDLVLVTGSLYVVGEAMECYDRLKLG